MQPSLAAACTGAAASSTVCKCEQMQSVATVATAPQAAKQGVLSPAGEEDGEAEAVRGAAAVAAGVRGKIQRLQQAVADKDCQIVALASRAEALAAAQQAALAAAAEQRVAALADARREHEAEVTKLRASVHLVNGEKEALAARCAELLADLSGLQAECARQIGALKEGVARELRRQKEMWVAGERSKREAWMAEKEKSIK